VEIQAQLLKGQDLENIFAAQRKAIRKGILSSVQDRKQALQKFRKLIKEHEDAILNALHLDLGKPETEGYLAEILFVYNDIDHHLDHLSKWVQPERVSTSLFNQPGSSWIYPEPYGSVLIIAPWNYPVQLLVAPAVAAIAAGNAVVLKPSEISSHTEQVLFQMLNDAFDENILRVVTGGKEVVEDLIDARPDYIFFTGSTKIGSIIMQHAAKYLIPVTLELGGKSPCIVHKDAKMNTAVSRILWGKCMNAGQTCIAPDYILIQESVLDDFVKLFKARLEERYGSNILESKDYSKIISKHHYDRLLGLISGDIILGGEVDDDAQKIAPTLLLNPPLDHPVMKEEIFGPVMPLITYKRIEDAIDYIYKFDKPLALYLFSESKKIQDLVLAKTSSGGVCINDTIVHIASNSLPFGGVGSSGIGAYHGKFGFDTFSNRKAVMKKSTLIDPAIRYPPYSFSLKKFEKLLLWLAK